MKLHRIAVSLVLALTLGSMAESFSGFQVTGSIGDDMAEAVAVRGKRAGMIQFVRVGGAWKIGEM